MRVWHVTFTALGFHMNAVVVHHGRGDAIAMLRLGEECREVEAFEIGRALSESPYVVCEDRLEVP